jgi:hypothetical protein
MTHLLILLPIHLLIHLPILLPILLQVDGRKGRGTEGAERERLRMEVMSSGGKGASLTGEKSQQRQAPITPLFSPDPHDNRGEKSTFVGCSAIALFV